MIPEERIFLMQIIRSSMEATNNTMSRLTTAITGAGGDDLALSNQMLFLAAESMKSAIRYADHAREQLVHHHGQPALAVRSVVSTTPSDTELGGQTEKSPSK